MAGNARADGLRALNSLRTLVAELQAALDKAVDQLQSETSVPDVQEYLDNQAQAAKDSYRQQLELWRTVLPAQGEEESAVSCVEADVAALETGADRKAALQQRLAAMGAMPALGNGMVLPRGGAARERSLLGTGSPAAREIFLNKHGVELAASPRLATPAGQATPPPWMEELRAKRVQSAAKAGDSVAGTVEVASELGAALAARAASLKVAAE